jgi:hypothetical protein
MKLTLEMREAAKAENAELKTKSRMSATAIARLRETKEQETKNKSADARLVEHFNGQQKTVENVMDWLHLIRKEQTANIRKRAIKCFHFLSRGYKVYGIHDLTFFGELLPEEERMSIAAILNKYPSAVEVIAPTQTVAAPERLCALGSKCARAVRRKGAPVSGNGKYCGQPCKSRAMRLAKRLETESATA